MGRDSQRPRQMPAPAQSEEKGRKPYFSYGFSALGMIAGLVFGLAFSWAQGPLPERNTEPYQLRAVDLTHYQIAIALEYHQSGNLLKAFEKLIDLRPAIDPLQALADAACELANSDYVLSESGVRALRLTVELYISQGRSGCADQLLPTGLSLAVRETVADPAALAPTEAPPPTKTPQQRSVSPAPTLRVVATAVPKRQFSPRPASTYCDSEYPALIEVYVIDYLGRGVPGQGIRVRWGDHEDIFVSGLKTDRGPAYADFQMEESISYSIDMPGASDALQADLSTGPCYTASGRESLKSYRVRFQESG